VFFRILTTSYVPLCIDTLHLQEHISSNNQVIYIVLQSESVLLCIRRGKTEYEIYTASG